jgi:CBS domain-containing protein/sporulation protein YlmC with PRC-barrel domain
MEKTTSSTLSDLVIPSTETISPDESVTVARRRMESQTSRSLIVVEGERPVGIVKWSGLSRQEAAVTVRDVMLTEVPLLRADMTIDQVRNEWANMDVDLDHLPVVDDSGALIGEVARGTITKSETATTGATEQVVAGPEQDRDVPTLRLEQGMNVVGISGKKLGTIDEVDLNSEGHIGHFTVKHGMLGRHAKRLPADVINNVTNGDVNLNIDQMEFKMLADTDEDVV